MPFEWTKDLSVGIEAIDVQHRELFKRIDGLVAAIDEGKGVEDVHGVFLFLSDYIASHFATEEKCMRILSYPGKAHHQERHKVFVDTVAELEKNYTEDGATRELTERVRQDICDWIIDHIYIVDTELGGFIKERGGDLFGGETA